MMEVREVNGGFFVRGETQSEKDLLSGLAMLALIHGGQPNQQLLSGANRKYLGQMLTRLNHLHRLCADEESQLDYQLLGGEASQLFTEGDEKMAEHPNKMYYTNGYRLVEDVVETDEGEQVKIVSLLDARIVCDRKLSRDELNKAGLVMTLRGWDELTPDNLFSRCIEEVQASRSSDSIQQSHHP